MNAENSTRRIYTQATAGEGPLFNGVQYKELNLHAYDEGQPYFLSDDWIDGSIRYDGGTYDNISIQYELLHDKVIIDHPLSHFKLELISAKVESFTLDGHAFVRIVDDGSKTSVKTGFYERLYNGKNIKVYARHKKDKQEHLENGLIKYIFNERTQYFILKDNAYYPVKSKASVLKVFYAKKVSLRKYLKKNKINFNKNTASAIAKSAEFYEESEKQP